MILTEIDEFAGKTIKKAEFNGYDELVFLFTNGDCAVLESDRDYDGSIDLSLAGELTENQQLLCGLITEKELAALRWKRLDKSRTERENAERQQLAWLKAKYENAQAT